jgi:hypothetical protein
MKMLGAKRGVSAILLGGALWVTSANAAVIVLDFEGVGDVEPVGDFYAGGTSTLGVTGPDLGITFSDNALALVSVLAGGSGDFENNPLGDTILFFLTGDTATMNVSGGFDSAFSFSYSAAEAAFVNVYDQLDGTGNLLASLELAPQFNVGCPADATTLFCNWSEVGVTFEGTAFSVDFGGTIDLVGFDAITIGAEAPEPPPPPAPPPPTPPPVAVSAPPTLGLLALGLIGLIARRKVFH